REFPRIAAGHALQFQLFEHLRGALAELGIAQAVQRAIKTHQLSRRPMVERNVLRQKSHAPPRRSVTKTVAQHLAMAAGRKHQAERDVNCRGFACAIRSEKTEDLALLHSK